MMIIAFLLISVSSQVLKKVSNCMDSCQNCPLYEPFKCVASTSLQTCEQGYFYNNTSKQCTIKPSMQANYVSLQFTEQRLSTIDETSLTTWKQGKVSQCSFIDQQGVQKYFSVVGLFREIYSISREFEVSQHHSAYLFSFNLVRSSWMPHNDFLILDIESGTQLVGSYEISYDNREGFADYSYISCNGEQVVTQKFNIKVDHKATKSSKIKITFTGFLFTSVWGISNIKFVPGCQKFTVYNNFTGSCDFCDSGYFPVYIKSENASAINNLQQLSKCTKCPYQCTQCLNETFCSACAKGYRLLANYSCVPHDDYTKFSLEEYFNSELKICREMNSSFFHNSQKFSISTLDLNNQNQKPFGNIFVVFDFVYNTRFLSMDESIDIQVNAIKMGEISKLNLTNKGFSACSSQSLERYSVQKITMSLSNIPEKISMTFKQVGNCTDCKFGISKLNIFHSESNSIDTTQLQNLKFYSSEKEAVQSIQVKTSSSIVLGTQNSQTQSVQNVTVIPFEEITNQQKNEASTQNKTDVIKAVQESGDDEQLQTEENTSSETYDSKQKKNSTKSQNSTWIDHLAFSKNGNNGLVIRLDSKKFPVLPEGSSYLIELSSTAKDQLKKQQTESVLYEAVAQHDVVPLLLSQQSETQKDTNMLAFYTDKTYLNDKVTIYKVQGSVKSKLANFEIERVDYLQTDSQQVASAFQKFFSVFAWVAIILTFVALFTGKVYLVEESIQSMQFVFLGIYVFTSYLPASIVNTVSGLRRLENFDFFAQNHVESIQNFFLGDLIQQGPLRFTLFHKDINFTRGIIPVVFVLIIVGLWFLVMVLLSMKLNKSHKQAQNLMNDNNILSFRQEGLQTQPMTWLKHLDDIVTSDIVSNKLDYGIQVFKLLFLPVLFLCFKQFNNFSYPQNQSGSVFNMLFCLFVFISLMIGAIVVVVVSSRKYDKLEYDTFIKSFPSIYYKKIPRDCLPTQSHRLVYPLIRYLKIFIFSLLVGLLGNHTVIVFVIMTVVYAGEIFYAWMHDVYQDSLHFKFLFVESLMLGVLLLLQLILSEISGVISTSGYLAFGYVYMSIAIAILLIGLTRSAYLIFDYISEKKGYYYKNDGIPSERIV